jgi:L-aspartate oxidase
VDANAATDIENLYAVGETACTGLHGANRLASNSLLEGLVFGARVAQAMREQRDVSQRFTSHAEGVGRASSSDFSGIRQCFRQEMWRHAGVVRTHSGLTQLLAKIESWQRASTSAGGREEIELHNLFTLGKLIAQSALAREESRGAHFRSDFPKHDDAKFRKHSVVIGSRISYK